MGDLRVDSAVEALGDGRYRGHVSEDWNLMGPVGGFLASLALRAAGVHTNLSRPLSFSCHFLSIASFAPVDLEVEIIRPGRRAESLRVSMRQNEKPVLEAIVWAGAAGLRGPECTWAGPRDVPAPEGLALLGEVDNDKFAGTPFWKNIQIRPIVLEGESEEPGSEPMIRAWDRFHPQPTFEDDPWLDACRSVVIIDVSQFPAVAKGFAPLEFVAPSLDLYVSFHDTAPKDEYLLIEANALGASGGAIGGSARIWSRDGRLVATGAQQMLCRYFRPPS